MSGYKFACAYRKWAQCMNLRYVSVNVSPKYPGARADGWARPPVLTDRQTDRARLAGLLSSAHLAIGAPQPEAARF